MVPPRNLQRLRQARAAAQADLPHGAGCTEGDRQGLRRQWLLELGLRADALLKRSVPGAAGAPAADAERSAAAVLSAAAAVPPAATELPVVAVGSATLRTRGGIRKSSAPFSLGAYAIQSLYMVDTQVISKSKKGLSQIAEDILQEAEKTISGAAILALYGNLGSGKTTFTQELAKVLGITERVISPTFILEKIYKLSGHSRFLHLIHIDAYRLESVDELKTLGWDELIKEKENLIVIEWADKIEEALPENTTRMYFKFIDEEKREIQW